MRNTPAKEQLLNHMNSWTVYQSWPSNRSILGSTRTIRLSKVYCAQLWAIWWFVPLCKLRYLLPSFTNYVILTAVGCLGSVEGRTGSSGRAETVETQQPQHALGAPARNFLFRPHWAEGKSGDRFRHDKKKKGVPSPSHLNCSATAIKVPCGRNCWGRQRELDGSP